MVSPEIWGKHGWKFIHYVAQGYPEEPTLENITDYKNFFINLHKILPCYKCQQNYKKHLTQNPLTNHDLKNKENLEKWVISIHNQVNEMNNKKIINVDEAKKLNTCQDDTCQDDLNESKDIPKNNNQQYIIIICILIAIILFFFIKEKI